MIIDMHACITAPGDEFIANMRARGTPGDPEDCLVEGSLRRMDATGVDKSVTWKIGTNADECRTNNDYVAAQRDRHPDRLIGFATVDPHEPDKACAEVDRAVDELGLDGIKLHPNVMGIPMDDPGFVTVVAHVAARQVPFVTHVNMTLASELPIQSQSDGGEPEFSNHTENAQAGRLRPLVDRYDSPRFQAAHMGGVTLDWIRGTQVTFQTTGAGVATLAWAVANVGVERIVFGSDFPFFLVEDELDKIRRLDISDDDRQRILAGNAMERVLGGQSR